VIGKIRGEKSGNTDSDTQNRKVIGGGTSRILMKKTEERAVKKEPLE